MKIWCDRDGLVRSEDGPMGIWKLELRTSLSEMDFFSRSWEQVETPFSHIQLPLWGGK